MVCPECAKRIIFTQQKTVFYEHRFWHIQCLRKYKERQKRNEQQRLNERRQKHLNGFMGN